jgi:hypothetical protein
MKRLVLVITVAISMVGMTASAHAATSTSGCDALQLVNQTTDEGAEVFADKWTVTQSSAVWDPDGWRGDYFWTMPSSIPTTGAPATLKVTATDKSGGRFGAELDLKGPATIEGGSPQATAHADKTGGTPTASGSTTFTIVPGCYADGQTLTLTIEVQDGPFINFNYTAVRAAAPPPPPNPCSTASSVFVAATCPGTLGDDTKQIPAPGGSVVASSPRVIPRNARTSTTSVISSTGQLGDTTIVAKADPAAEQRELIGQAVAACWLIGPDALNLPPALKRELSGRPWTFLLKSASASGKLRFCLALVRELGETLAQPPAPSSAAGCAATRLRIAVKRRHGRIVSAVVSRRAPGRGDLRYSCQAGAAGSMTIKADGRRRGGLRRAVGTTFKFGVYRARSAPAESGTMSFGFGV